MALSLERNDVTQTKLRMPQLSAFVSRPRLEAHAERIVATPITIVAAGAGFGKTTLLRAWAERAQADSTVAWLSLEPSEASIRAFALYLDAALRRAAPEIGQSVMRVIRERIDEPAPYISAFTNELLAYTEERDQHVAIFLDDYHAVDAAPGLAEFVGGLMRSLPPLVHLVIATRFPVVFSPLPKLRADDRVADFDQSDLRFTTAEASQLLADAGLERPDENAIAEFVDKTDGWAMALRLSVQTAKRQGGDIVAAVATDSKRSLFGYLAEEVLREQPAEVRRSLYACAIPERLDARIAGILLDTDDGASALVTLLERNLYLERVGEGEYRFHALFRDFLRESFEREEPEESRALHARLATYLRDVGDLMGAVTHMIEAGDLVGAAEHVAQAQATIKFSDRFEQIYHLLRRIPDELKRDKPRLIQLEATALHRMGNVEGAEEAFERARSAAVACGDFATACSCACERGMLADRFESGGHGEFEKSLELFKEALQYAEKCVGPRRDIYVKQASLLLGLAYGARFEYDAAAPLLETAKRLQLASEKQMTGLLTTIATVYGWQGEWHRALEESELDEELLRNGGGDFLVGRATCMQAKAHVYLREDVARAVTLAQAAVDSLMLYERFEDLADAYIVLARAQLAQSPPNVEEAWQALREAQRRAPSSPSPVTLFEIHAVTIEALLCAERFGEAKYELTAALSRAKLNHDPHQIAVTHFFTGLLARCAGDEAGSIDAFELAWSDFTELHDRFYAQVSDLALAAARVRLGRLEAGQLRAMLDRFEEGGAASALRSAPRSASLLLAWALRNGVDVPRAETLLGPSALSVGAKEIIEVASDTSAPSAGRVNAIAFIAPQRRSDLRAQFTKLSRDSDRAVAAAAATALQVLPQTGVAPVHICVVGPVRVTIGDATIEERDARWTRKKAVELLRLIVLAEGPVQKLAVLDALWPQTPQASAETSLRVTLHALRRAIEPQVEGSGHYVEYDGASVRFNRDLLGSVDAVDGLGLFRKGAFALARKNDAEATVAFERVVEIFTRVGNEENASDWLAPHVRRWRDAAGSALRGLAAIRLRGGDVAGAREQLERALRIEPLDEEAVALYLDACLAVNDVDGAREMFVTYKRRLSDELSATPGSALLGKYSEVLSRRSQARQADLSEREVEVLRLVALGKSNKEIAVKLDLSPWTVNNHVARILRKLNVESRAAAVAIAGGLLER